MSWFETSVMACKGVARGEARTTHVMTEAYQGKYHYIYGPYVDPGLHVAPGPVVSVETHDAFGGKIRSELDSPSAVLNFPFLNPQSGPIFIEGAEKGDCLAVRIVSIRPRGPQSVGTTVVIPDSGGLMSTGVHGSA